MPNDPISFQKLHPEATLPARQTPGAACFDIFACILQAQNRPSKMTIPMRETINVPTGLYIRPPSNYCVLVCSRSGMAANGVFVANAPGIIDPDYRGELRVLLYNGSFAPYIISHEDRIAQLLVFPLHTYEVVEVTDIPPDTLRGRQGFGHTGNFGNRGSH